MNELVNKVIADKINDVVFYINDLGYTLDQALARAKSESTLGSKSWAEVVNVVTKCTRVSHEIILL